MIYFKIIAPKELFRLINFFFLSTHSLRLTHTYIAHIKSMRRERMYKCYRCDVTPSQSAFTGWSGIVAAEKKEVEDRRKTRKLDRKSKVKLTM